MERVRIKCQAIEGTLRTFKAHSREQFEALTSEAQTLENEIITLGDKFDSHAYKETNS